MGDSITITEDHINRLKDLDLIIWYGETYGLEIELGVEPMFSTPEGFEHKQVYGVNDIMYEFNCKKDKAYRIMLLMFDMKYAMQLGKSYYVKKEMLDRFMEDNRGKKLYL